MPSAWTPVSVRLELWMRLHARKHFAERRLDFFLHARADLLHLPALVGRAVVGDDEFEFH